MGKNRYIMHPIRRWLGSLISIALLVCTPVAAASATNGSVIYTYDALGRVLTASYDTGVIVITATMPMATGHSRSST
jgi:hypothetical protein